MSAAGDGPRITAYRDGPLLVRGPFHLEDQDGNPIETREGTIALCRCGKSRMRPFCDGTHRLVGFRVPSCAEVGRERQTASRAGSSPRSELSPASQAPSR